MFYKSGLTPKPEEPIIPAKGGCKPGWWAYAGYCYKDFGRTQGFDTSGFKNYMLGNSSCVAGTGGNGQPDWPGSRMAILPSIQHNHLLASLMGPGRSGINEQDRPTERNLVGSVRGILIKISSGHLDRNLQQCLL